MFLLDEELSGWPLSCLIRHWWINYVSILKDKPILKLKSYRNTCNHALPLTQHFHWWFSVSFISEGKHLYINLCFFGLFRSWLHLQSVVKDLQRRGGSSEIIITYIRSWYLYHVLFCLAQGMKFQLWSINDVKRQANWKTNITFDRKYQTWLEKVSFVDLLLWVLFWLLFILHSINVAKGFG